MANIPENIFNGFVFKGCREFSGVSGSRKHLPRQTAIFYLKIKSKTGILNQSNYSRYTQIAHAKNASAPACTSQKQAWDR